MKHIILLASVLIALNAQAVTLNWTVSNVSFNGTKLDATTGATMTAYLAYLGNGGSLAPSYTESTLMALTTVDSATGTTSKGKISGAYDLPVSTSAANGDVYAMFFKYVTGGKTYYNLVSTTYTVSGVADATSNISNFAPTPSFATSTATDGTITAGGGWVAAAAVPEPATGALALAGIALLFKRRKARA